MYISLREQIADAIVEILQSIDDPKCVLVTREPFEVEKLAITQFPALLIQMTSEDRQTITMGMGGQGRRQGVITYNIRGFVRGTDLDKRRNELTTAIETALDTDRYLGLAEHGVTDSQLTRVEIVNRLPPLAELSLTFIVNYNYLRGQA